MYANKHIQKGILRLWYLIAIGFGIGIISNKIPVGTVASLAAIPIWWILVYFFSYKGYLLFLILVIVIGIHCCDRINNVIGVHDHKSIVWDEFVGMWVTLTYVPYWNWLWISIAFVLFRVLDIAKPWPISWVDRVVKGGIGIIMDDILAGLISIYILLYLMKIDII